MSQIRNVLKWIQKHRALSLSILIVTLISVFIVSMIQDRSRGTLTAPLQKGRIIQSVYGIGTVMANKSYQLKVGVVSTIEELYVREGDQVQRGVRLAKIDGNTYKAPFTGTITALPFKIRENVFSNSPILTLVDLTDRYLLVSLEQQGALRVKRGQNVKMSFDTIREQNYDGTVQSVYSNESNFLARIDISSLPERILPGMTADVAITLETRDQALLIPVAALEKGNIVWRKRGHSIASRVPVKLGIIDKDMAEVTSGDLNVDDQLLIRTVIKP